MNIEARLGELVGEAAGRLHTARSRNDQVATDFRLWVRDAIDEIDGQLVSPAASSCRNRRAEKHAATVMPGFTHLQNAQPVTFGHHCLAYVEMFARDRGRFADARRRLNECPLGAAALAGTAYPIDRESDGWRAWFRPTGGKLPGRRFGSGFCPGSALCGMRSVPCICQDLQRNWLSGRAPSSVSFAFPTSFRPGHRSCRRSEIRTRPSWSAPRPAGFSAR